MAERIPYLDWHNRSHNVIPDTHRIGDDLILIEDYQIGEVHYSPFKVDATTAIIYEEGNVDIMINMKKYHISAPAMVVMLSGHTYQYLSTEIHPKIKAITYSDKLLTDLFNDPHLTASLYRSTFENPILELNEDSRFVIQQFYNMTLNLIKSPTGKFRLEAAKHLILTIFYGYMIKENIPTQTVGDKQNRATELSDRFFELLRSDYLTSRDVGYYADKLYVTPKYLSRCIKEVTSRTATDWIESYVINESKALLTSTTLTIQQISDRLGFMSTALFGKYFKRVEGITPSAYRKSRKNS